jgi:tetratricopeptide (TPR) repeat protein
MFDRHPPPSVLAQLGNGELARATQREVVRHLLTGCPACRAAAERLVPPAAAAFPAAPGRGSAVETGADDYSAAFAAARRALARHAASFAAERAAAPGLLRELGQHPFDRQWLLVTGEARFQNWAFCELLLATSHEQGFQDPARALELAELGAAVAAQLSFARYGEGRVRDLEARCWAVLANAERIRSDFRAAEKGFVRAERLLRAGTGDPLEKAWVLLLKASLRGNQQRFAEAFRLLDRVAALARRHGDVHLTGKALITKGFVCGVAGRLEESVEMLH